MEMKAAMIAGLPEKTAIVQPSTSTRVDVGINLKNTQPTIRLEFAGSWAYRIPADQQNVIHPLEYMDFLERQVSVAIVRAWESRKPGEFSSALGHASVARNRRAVFFDGTTRMYGHTNDPEFSETGT